MGCPWYMGDMGDMCDMGDIGMVDMCVCTPDGVPV